MKKQVSVPSIYIIPCNRRLISFATTLVYFGVASPLSRCLHSWYFPVFEKTNAFIFPVWIVTSPVVLFVCTQYYHFLCTVVLVDDGVGSCLGVRIVSTWLAMRLWPFRRLYLVLYMYTSGTLYVLPSCGSGICGITSVLSGMTWGSVWGGLLFACPGVIVILVLMCTLWRGADSGGTVMVGCCVIPLFYGGSVIFTP